MNNSSYPVPHDDSYGGPRSGMIVGGNYFLMKEIGEGATGTVWEAQDNLVQRRVALKMLHPQLATNLDLVTRIRREARILGTLNHPNIVTVYTVGQRRDGSFFIVQELLQGCTLRERLGKERRLSPAAALDLLIPIAAALVVVHRQSILHRDLKPENIFLVASRSAHFVPKLIDFGIAQTKSIIGGDESVERGRWYGTAEYMSPEQVRAQGPLDVQSDVWAMGVVLFEVLTGRVPFQGDGTLEVMRKILDESQKPPSIDSLVPGLPPELCSIVEAALERDKNRRLPSMEILLERLIDLALQLDPTLVTRHALSLPDQFTVPVRFREARVSRLPKGLAIPSKFAVPAHLTPPPVPNIAPTMVSEFEEFDVQELDDEDIIVDLDTAGEPPFQLLVPMIHSQRPPATGDINYSPAPPPVAEATPSAMEARANGAEEALRVNLLTEAVEHAQVAIDDHADGETLGRLLLVQAIGSFWLGRYKDAHFCAQRAMAKLARGTPRWYEAFGHLIMTTGHLGQNDELRNLAVDLNDVGQVAQNTGAHIIASCQLSIWLLRAGELRLAERIRVGAKAMVDGLTDWKPVIDAWMHVADAEVAVKQGDFTTALRHFESSVERFIEVGDPRNVCFQRVNIGNAYMQLGEYAKAESRLQEAVTVGEPLKLSFITSAMANLGCAVARKGDLSRAYEVEKRALTLLVEQGYSRFEAVARIYLASILALQGREVEAEIEAKAAVAASSSAPSVRAYALATLADVMLRQGRQDEASGPAKEAMAILELLECVEEGEALIRLMYASVLKASGDHASAHQRIMSARRMVVQRASQIGNSVLRRSFLENIPENVRILALAGLWLDDGHESASTEPGPLQPAVRPTQTAANRTMPARQPQETRTKRRGPKSPRKQGPAS